MSLSNAEKAALDRLPSITLAEIRKAGLFHPRAFLERPVFTIFAKAGKAYKEYVVQNDRTRSRIVFIDDNKPDVKPIEVEYVRSNEGFVAVCGPDRAETTMLYCYKGQIVGPELIVEALRPKRPEVVLAETLARLKGTDGRRPSRGATRQRLLQGLQQGPFRADTGVKALLKAERERAQQRKKARSGLEARREDPLDTGSGLRRGEGAPADPSEDRAWESFEAALVGCARSQDAQGLPLRGEPLPTHFGRGVLEDHPRLDLRTLAKAGYLQPGERRRGALDWSGATPLIDGLRFIVDLRCGASPHIAVEMMRGGRATYQRLQLTRSAQGGRVRWAFVCPVSGAVSEVLALRYGRFASAKAQRLVHRSQMNKARVGLQRSRSSVANAGAS